MKKFKLVLIILLSIVLVLALGIGIFIIVLDVKSKRIGNIDIEIQNNQESIIEKETEYTALTYNIGFGEIGRAHV